MPFKVTILFQQATGAAAGGTTQAEHIGGWSESYYSSLSTPAAIRTNLEDSLGFLWARSRLLPLAGQIIGYRLAPFDVTTGRSGRSQTSSSIWPGVAFRQPDVPQMSLLCSVNAASASNVRRFGIRSIPDSEVVNGEFQPDPGFASQLADFFTQLSNWQFVGRDLTTPVYNVLSISVGGVVITAPANTLATGDKVRFKNVKITLTGQLVSFTTTVIATGVGTFTIQDWPAVDATGGTVTALKYALFTMDGSSASVVRVSTRKVGRPFGQYRGRRSKRRAVA